MSGRNWVLHQGKPAFPNLLPGIGKGYCPHNPQLKLGRHFSTRSPFFTLGLQGFAAFAAFSLIC